MVLLYAFFDLHLSQSAIICRLRSANSNIFESSHFLICKNFNLQNIWSTEFSKRIQVTRSDFNLHSFCSAIFWSAKILLCSVFNLHGFWFVMIWIYMYFDMQINFWSANYFFIYVYFDLQNPFPSSNISIYELHFDL